MSTRKRGRVRWFDARRGWGFIRLADGGDVFLHSKNLKGLAPHELRQGDLLEFDVERGPKGFRAFRVRRASQDAEISPLDAPRAAPLAQQDAR